MSQYDTISFSEARISSVFILKLKKEEKSVRTIAQALCIDFNGMMRSRLPFAKVMERPKCGERKGSAHVAKICKPIIPAQWRSVSWLGVAWLQWNRLTNVYLWYNSGCGSRMNWEVYRNILSASLQSNHDIGYWLVSLICNASVQGRKLIWDLICLINQRRSASVSDSMWSTALIHFNTLIFKQAYLCY